MAGHRPRRPDSECSTHPSTWRTYPRRTKDRTRASHAAPRRGRRDSASRTPAPTARGTTRGGFSLARRRLRLRVLDRIAARLSKRDACPPGGAHQGRPTAPAVPRSPPCVRDPHVGGRRGTRRNLALPWTRESLNDSRRLRAPDPGDAGTIGGSHGCDPRTPEQSDRLAVWGMDWGTREGKTPGGSPVGGHFVRGLLARPEGFEPPTY